jgi:hypothetical protein
MSCSFGRASDYKLSRPCLFRKGNRITPILSRVESAQNQEELMTGKRKSAVGRAGRSEADLGQKEAQLEKTQAELETASEAQLSHMEGGKAAKAAQKAKIRSK